MTIIGFAAARGKSHSCPENTLAIAKGVLKLPNDILLTIGEVHWVLRQDIVIIRPETELKTT